MRATDRRRDTTKSRSLAEFTPRVAWGLRTTRGRECAFVETVSERARLRCRTVEGAKREVSPSERMRATDRRRDTTKIRTTRGTE
jgi:hypothetical protein